VEPDVGEAPTNSSSPLRRNRDFVILWSGQAVSELGSSMSMLVFPLIGYAITGSAGLAGLATAATLLGQVVAGLPAGAMVDRWPRRRVLLVVPLGCSSVLVLVTRRLGR
jgi:MFS family permease